MNITTTTLTDERILEIANKTGVKIRTGNTAIKFARAIIAEVQAAGGVPVAYRHRYLYKNRGPELTSWHLTQDPLDFDSQYRSYEKFEEEPLYTFPPTEATQQQNNPASLSPSDAQTASMSLHAAPSDVADGGGYSEASQGGGDKPYVLTHAVRRLTPTECERLQGFPDGYTNIPKASDGPRYKALGNSKATTKIRWLGQRIKDHMEQIGYLK